jgi:hypothetical protein
MDKEETEGSIKWLDNIPLSRHTGNFSRDISNGGMMAELLKYSYPQYVDVHNYSPAFTRASEVDSWSTLNRKVLTKLNLCVSDTMIEKIISGTKGAILSLLT